MNKQTQSTTYQQLCAALEKEGCPVCHLGLDASRRYLDSILWDSVNDRGIRETLSKSLGFCGRHSRELLTFAGERLGVAIIQKAVLQDYLRHLQDMSAPARRSILERIPFIQSRVGAGRESNAADRDIMPLGPDEDCPACVQQRRVEQRAIAELLGHLRDDLDAPLRQAGGLCIPHLQTAMQHSRAQSVWDTLTALHRDAWEEMLQHLSEFIRKSDHRFRGEPITEAERAAVDRAIITLTGVYPLR